MTEELVRQEPGDLERYDVDTGTYGEEQTELDKLLERSAELRARATGEQWVVAAADEYIPKEGYGRIAYSVVRGLFLRTPTLLAKGAALKLSDAADGGLDSFLCAAHEHNTGEAKDGIIRVLVNALKEIQHHHSFPRGPHRGCTTKTCAHALAEVERIAGEANKA